MAKKSRSGNLKPEHLICAAGGALIGAWWVNNQTEESQKSRIERDDPDFTRETCEVISPLLDDWEPAEDCETEDDFVRDLAAYLEENTDFEIEVTPDTPHGKPDILVEGALALECKIDPSKAERDRCVGQCAGYSIGWVTWIVLIDAPESNVQKMENLLADKGLNQILIWNFD